MKILFWCSWISILYVYVGYPLILWLGLRRCSSGTRAAIKEWPSVSLIITARNEERALGGKLGSILSLDYPADRLEIFVCSDGSTDRTADIARRYGERLCRLPGAPSLRVIASDAHEGKSAMQNRAVAASRGEIIVFSDATGRVPFYSLKALVEPFADPQVGCATGQACYASSSRGAAAQGEGLYWRYEQWIQAMESDWGVLAMGSGWWLAVRRSLWRPLKAAHGEDFVVPLQTLRQGYRNVRAAEAVVFDELVQETDDLFRMKSRIIAKDFKGLLAFSELLNPFRNLKIAWALVSHKLMRWLLPVALIIGWGAALALGRQTPWSAYSALAFLQTAFYGAALIGWSLQRAGSPKAAWRPLAIPLSFSVVNLAALAGLWRWATGQVSGRWNPAREAAAGCWTGDLG